MSLLGNDMSGSATINGLTEVNANNVYSDVLYYDASTTPVNVKTAIDGLQAEIDAIDTSIIGISQGYWGSFWSTSTQTNAGTTSTNLMTFNNSDTNNNAVSIGSSSSQLKVTNAGVYNIQFSAQLDKTDAGDDLIDIWLRLNGTNVTDSGGALTITTNNGKLLAAWNYILKLSANDYIEFAWASLDIDMRLFYQAASTGPPSHPAIPSVIATLQQVSNTMTGKSDVIAVGSTTTLAAGSSAYVTDTTTINPTYTLHTLAFGIPKGDQGTQGNPGATGPTGPQGPIGPTGDTNATAIAALALATSTAAAVGVISTVTIPAIQATDVIQSGQITGAQTDITALQQITSGQTYGSLTGTTFAQKVNVLNAGGGPTTNAVTLGSFTASTFLYGLSSSAAITSSSGTSQVSGLLVNADAEVTGNLSITNGPLYISRSTVANTKKIVLYDGATGNDYDYLGMWTSQSVGKNYFNYEIDGTGGAFRWHYGNGFGNARKKILEIDDSDFYSYASTFSFLNSQIGGQTQNITFIDGALGTFYMKWKTDADVTATQNADARIIVDAGADGVEDDGTMTLISGAHNITATTRDIVIEAYGSLLFTSTTGFWTAQSSNNFYYESSLNDYSIYYGNQLGTQYFSTDIIGSSNEVSLYSSNCKINLYSDVAVSIGVGSEPTDIGGSQITLTGTTDINTAGTAATSIGNATGALALTGSTNTILGTTNINTTGTLSTSIGNATGTNTILGTTDINFTGANNTRIGNTGTLTLKGNTLASTTTGNTTITSSGGDVTLSGTDVSITTTGTSAGEFIVRANTNVDIKANNGNLELNALTTMLITSGGTQTTFVDTENKMVITSTTTTLTNDNIVIDNKNELFGPPLSTTAATVNAAFPLESLYMITGTTASNRNYVLPTATAANAGAIFKLVNLVPSNTVDYIITISTTGTQYLTLGNGDATLLLQSYQLQMDETSVEFIYNGSNYWVCMSPRPVIPTGTIISYPIAMNSTRYGLQNRYVLCDGSSLNATANPKYFNLWKVIGTTFGGTGVTAFSVPDLQGTVLKGAGTKTVSQTSNSYSGGTISVAHTATISAFQTDATLVIKCLGYWSAGSGGGAQSRSRTRIPTDTPIESNPANDTSIYVDRYADEVRVYNMGVNWYIKL